MDAVPECRIPAKFRRRARFEQHLVDVQDDAARVAQQLAIAAALRLDSGKLSLAGDKELFVQLQAIAE